MEQNIWIQDGNTFMKGSATTKAHPEGLPKGIYEVKESMTGYYLNRLGDSFVFNYKLYGINNKFIDHFIKTYNIVKYSYLPLMSQKLIIIYQVVHHVLDMYVLLAIYLKKPHLSYLMIF